MVAPLLGPVQFYSITGRFLIHVTFLWLSGIVAHGVATSVRNATLRIFQRRILWILVTLNQVSLINLIKHRVFFLLCDIYIQLIKCFL